MASIMRGDNIIGISCDMVLMCGGKPVGLRRA